MYDHLNTMQLQKLSFGATSSADYIQNGETTPTAHSERRLRAMLPVHADCRRPDPRRRRGGPDYSQRRVDGGCRTNDVENHPSFKPLCNNSIVKR